MANMLQSYKREAKLVFPATPRGWAAIKVTTIMYTIAPIWPCMRYRFVDPTLCT